MLLYKVTRRPSAGVAERTFDAAGEGDKEVTLDPFVVIGVPVILALVTAGANFGANMLLEREKLASALQLESHKEQLFRGRSSPPPGTTPPGVPPPAAPPR